MKSGRFIAGALSLCVMGTNFIGMNAGAADIVAEGQCGDNASWTLDSEGNFIVSGSGEMWEWRCRYLYMSESDIDISWIEDQKCPWFDMRDQIKSVTISEGITYLGEYAFLDCDNLTTISLPKSLINCGSGATFNHCDNLTGVVLPDSLETLNGCFEYCPKITSIDIPETVTHIADDAFDMCAGLKVVIVRTKECYLPDTDSVFSNGWDETTLKRYFNGVVYGWKGSDMDAYCQKAGLDFVPFSLGDVNLDASVNALDASVVLTAYADAAIGKASGFGSVENYCADTDADGNINALDASYILSYYSYTATGGEDTFEEYMK